MYTLTQVTGGHGKSRMGDDSTFIKLGPVGSKDGDEWDEKDRNRIVQIFISHDDEIRSIQFQYVENGTLVMSDRHGDNDNGGCKFDVVELNYPAEYITWISGHNSYYNLNLCSITFGTNSGKYGPFGQFTDNDREFCFRLGKDNRQFGGFHGIANEYKVESIGVYLKPIMTLGYSSDENLEERDQLQKFQKTSSEQPTSDSKCGGVESRSASKKSSKSNKKMEKMDSEDLIRRYFS